MFPLIQNFVTSQVMLSYLIFTKWISLESQKDIDLHKFNYHLLTQTLLSFYPN